MADRTLRVLAAHAWGICVNLLAVPLIALTGRRETAAALMICERLGKAIRSPARDTLLSYATQEIGHGWGFGLHEVRGSRPACARTLNGTAVLLAVPGAYRFGFAVLLRPR